MKRLIVANWKMNPDTPREARALILATKREMSKLRRTTVVLCPPAIFIPLVIPGRRPARRQGGVMIGAQDISTELRGAYTGSISVPMMKYSGAAYAIIGHSERRYPQTGGGETDEVVNKKVKLALSQNLRVILCVGERKRDPHGKYLAELRTSLESAINCLPRTAARGIIVVYEPIWAIGGETSAADTPAGFLEQAIFIRKVLSHWCGHTMALKLPILYGGSVGPKNVTSFITVGAADGFLVGHESLRADHWREIIRLVDRC